MGSTTYQDYISSEAWKVKRQERLTLDAGLCVVCKAPAESVHHLTYVHLGDEDVRTELVSVCAACHHHFDDLERFHRYQRRDHAIEIQQTISVSARTEVQNGMGFDEVSSSRGCAPDFAQWAKIGHQEV